MKKCSKCGSKMEADISAVYTSDPPMYMYTCPKCGNKEYGFCSENSNEDAGKDIIKDVNRKYLKEIIGKAKQEAEEDSKNIADTPALICARMFDYIYRALELKED